MSLFHSEHMRPNGRFLRLRVTVVVAAGVLVTAAAGAFAQADDDRLSNGA